MKFSWRPSWIGAKKTNFACLDFSRLLVCYSRDPFDLKTLKNLLLQFVWVLQYIDWTITWYINIILTFNYLNAINY